MKIKELIWLVMILSLLISCRVDKEGQSQMLIPQPQEIIVKKGNFPLPIPLHIYIQDPQARFSAEYLADHLHRQHELEAEIHGNNELPESISFLNDSSSLLQNEEAYRLQIDSNGIKITASAPAGWFYGCQTLLQLLPAEVYRTDSFSQNPWKLPYVNIIDSPRFPWRGAMLDVARHFFTVENVKRYIDLMAYHKLNRLHLHLSDDQGFRLMIHSWPKLAETGGSTQLGGGEGGYYSQQEYKEIIQYAQQRQIIVIPEIDMPGHTHAILASYPELNENNIAPELYLGAKVGFSSLAVDKELTYTMLEDVIKEIAAITPGPYIHIGGDEVFELEKEAYIAFILRVEQIVKAQGKTMIGWEEVRKAEISSGSIVQFWDKQDLADKALEQGNQLIISKASHFYLDMKYNKETQLGQVWAGLVSLKQTYAFHKQLPIEEEKILGLEAPLWTEYIYSMEDIEYMAFPRLTALAELAWSDPEHLDFTHFRQRLTGHGKRMDAMGIDFFRSPEVDWEP